MLCKNLILGLNYCLNISNINYQKKNSNKFLMIKKFQNFQKTMLFMKIIKIIQFPRILIFKNLKRLEY